MFSISYATEQEFTSVTGETLLSDRLKECNNGKAPKYYEEEYHIIKYKRLIIAGASLRNIADELHNGTACSGDRDSAG